MNCLETKGKSKVENRKSKVKDKDLPRSKGGRGGTQRMLTKLRFKGMIENS